MLLSRSFMGCRILKEMMQTISLPLSDAGLLMNHSRVQHGDFSCLSPEFYIFPIVRNKQI